MTDNDKRLNATHAQLLNILGFATFGGECTKCGDIMFYNVPKETKEAWGILNICAYIKKMNGFEEHCEIMTIKRLDGFGSESVCAIYEGERYIHVDVFNVFTDEKGGAQ